MKQLIRLRSRKAARVCGIDNERGVLVRWQNEITNDRRKYHLLRSPRWTTEIPPGWVGTSICDN